MPFAHPDELKQVEAEKKALEAKQRRSAAIETFLGCICSLRVVTICILALFFLLMFGGYLAVVLGVFTPTYNQLEDTTIRDASRRATRAIYDDFSGILKSMIVWSQWVRNVVCECLFVKN